MFGKEINLDTKKAGPMVSLLMGMLGMGGKAEGPNISDVGYAAGHKSVTDALQKSKEQTSEGTVTGATGDLSRSDAAKEEEAKRKEMAEKSMEPFKAWSQFKQQKRLERKSGSQLSLPFMGGN